MTSGWVREAEMLRRQAGYCRVMALTSALPGASQGFFDVADNLDRKASEIETAATAEPKRSADCFPPLRLRESQFG